MFRKKAGKPWFQKTAGKSREEEETELRKWFEEDEIRWLFRMHPAIAQIAADKNAGTQSIFTARCLIDAEYEPEKENRQRRKRKRRR